MDDPEATRAAGIAKMVEVYGDDRGFAERLADLPPESAPYTEATVDHVFAELWNRPGLSVRDRRLLTIGVTAAYGRADLAETQFVGALTNGELDRAQIGEVVLHLAYYAGWPNAQAMHRGATAAIERMPNGD
jgi:alkylhydroperoxidase/carboxymuconolactone decarboxylase family protein YurZ